MRIFPPAQRRFNPRPCARGDAPAGGRDWWAAVSIHAPARGATGGGGGGGGSSGFQSTPLREGRRILAYTPGDGRIVSIHAPARGATPTATTPTGGGSVSIHAPARGATPNPRAPRPGKPFQSTPLREGRLMAVSSPSNSVCFNPRPCARGDDPEGLAHVAQHVSIHAPARGATIAPRSARWWGVVSIHAPARGATTPCHRSLWSPCGFNPRPCARGDWRNVSRSSGTNMFQSTPLREGRQGHLRRWPRADARFNPRPCARGDCASRERPHPSILHPISAKRESQSANSRGPA